MTPGDFTTIATFLHTRSGLILTADKAYLLESRLTPVICRARLKNMAELAEAVRQKRDNALLNEIAEAMTTNESFFFRDQRPFDQLRTILLPHFVKTRAGRKKLRIWSAACSSGQEAYSAAITCKEETRLLDGWTIEIFGTDLSSAMVKRAREGIYSRFEVQRGLSITHLVKYFTKLSDNEWQINAPLRQITEFRESNLVHDPNPAGTFDIIFCRNVLIYFDGPTKSQVLDSLASSLAVDGALYLGGAESVLGFTDRLQMVENERGLYRSSVAPALMRAG